jgi:PAS domain S-box-containing protein
MANHGIPQSPMRDFVGFAGSQEPHRTWSLGSAAASFAAIIIAAMAFRISNPDLGRGILFVSIALLIVVAAFHARFLYFAREQNRQSNQLLSSKEREFQSLFENALDTIIVFDDNGVCQSANPSSWMLLSSPPERIVGQYVRHFYSNASDFDLMRNELVSRYRHQGEAQLVRANGETVFVEFTAAADFLPGRHLMILRDTTERRRAQQALSQSLVVVRSSWQETEALRLATLALTGDLRMDRVLETLLETLAGFVPYQHAQVFLCENDSRLFLAREATRENPAIVELGFPETLELSEFPLLKKLLLLEDGLLIEDTHRESSWNPLKENSAKWLPVRSWLAVPILSSHHVLGVLSLAHSSPSRFSPGHLRLTRSLATPSAVAIQNARLYERARIYGSELERRIVELNEAEQTLKESEHELRTSDERFQKVFRAAPVAMSVTSLNEGRFLAVNEAFERRFGFTRNAVLGRTVTEMGFWENPSEQTELIHRISGGEKVRSSIAHLRSKSGLLQSVRYSAELIDFDGQSCLLVASEDLPNPIA